MFKRLTCLVVALGLFLGGAALPAIASDTTSEESSETRFEPTGEKGGKGKGGKKGKGKGKGGKGGKGKGKKTEA